MAPVHLFENHDEAYRIWSAAGIRGASIVHVDAHHDLTWLDDRATLNIGNFLCQAIKDGIVAQVFWVVPDGALSSSRVRAFIARQLRALQSAYGEPSQSRLRGSRRLAVELAGASVAVCELDAVPALERPLLDVDVDFLMTPASATGSGRPASAPWLSARECAERLRAVAVAAGIVTIAYSVEGGYTPLRWKYLGDELALRLQASPDASALRGFDRLTRAHEHERLGQLDEAEHALADAAATMSNPAAAEFALAKLLAGRERFEPARAALRAALRHDPSYAAAYNGDGLPPRIHQSKEVLMSNVSLDTSLIVPDDVIFRELDGEAIILNLVSGNYFGLDEVGTRLWALLAASSTLRQAIAAIAAEYDVDGATVERDALELVGGLLDKGLVQVAPNP